MDHRSRLRGFVGLAAVFVVSAAPAALAQEVPIRNWSAPKTWARPAASGAPGVKRTLTDVTTPLPFVGVTPCRLADTRGGAGFTGQAGGPILAGNAVRNFQVGGIVAGLTTQCGIPIGAQAVSLNLTVTGMNTNGNLVAYPAFTIQPAASVINWNASSVAIGNAAVVAVGNNSISVFPNVPAGGQTHLIIDVNGYYSVGVSQDEGMNLIGNSGNGISLIHAYNFNPAGFAIGGAGTGTGIVGGSDGSGDTFAGVAGSSTNAVGVSGFSANTSGVRSQSLHLDGVTSFGGRDGGYFEGARNGVVGVSTGTAGLLSGVIGTSASTGVGSAGVRGQNYSGIPSGALNYAPAGVLATAVNGYSLLALTQLGGGTAGSFHRLNNASPFGETSRVDLCVTGSLAGSIFGDVIINPNPFGAAGNLTVVGSISKGSGSFKIDHPLDPENKYLYHSFVESPDMKNVYDGNVVLDAHGEAIVVLPDYFEALNTDFRYQLTSIGRSSQVLYVADEIQNNRFRIGGGRPGGKVSWQVTGIRQDAFAKAHRIHVEVEKAPEERGLYLHPAEHGQPEDKGMSTVYERTERAKETAAAQKQ